MFPAKKTENDKNELINDQQERNLTEILLFSFNSKLKQNHPFPHSNALIQWSHINLEQQRKQIHPYSSFLRKNMPELELPINYVSQMVSRVKRSENPGVTDDKRQLRMQAKEHAAFYSTAFYSPQTAAL